jgi:hypothetical protein
MIGMRRTLMLDDDLDAAVKDECRQSGISFNAVVNRALREGLLVQTSRCDAPVFKITPLRSGLREGISLDSISALEAVDEEEAFKLLASRTI